MDKGLGSQVEGILRNGQAPSPEAASVALINEIMGSSVRSFLILDDLHVIQDSVILGILERLVTNPPPKLHLVLISRDDPPLPLARLHASRAYCISYGVVPSNRRGFAFDHVVVSYAFSLLIEDPYPKYEWR